MEAPFSATHAGQPQGVSIARVSDTAVDLATHIAAVSGPKVGGIATFVGTVRDHDSEARGNVTLLEYSAHPGAEKVLGEIAAACAAPASADGEICTVAVSHRIGRLRVGEIAVVVAVGTAHRDTAFAVCREVIERVKAELPVWKRQHEDDGTSAWVGLDL
jgi:molybdopterin synthase catalytic subunit